MIISYLTVKCSKKASTESEIMASKLKRKKRKRERPNTMDLKEALKDPAWENEIRWADEIMSSNRRLGLSFKLDKLTKGEGSCSPISVV